MKRSKFSEEQIAYALRQAESGTPVRMLPADRRQRGHVPHLEEEVRPPGRQRAPAAAAVEDENRRLKQLVADLTLDKHMLSEALRKKV